MELDVFINRWLIKVEIENNCYSPTPYIILQKVFSKRANKKNSQQKEFGTQTVNKKFKIIDKKNMLTI